jgi:prepilin-type N-terminal cleavage/methylation domain-containing protein
MKKHNGFTLLELMVVVVVLGILVAIAVPSYHKTVNLALVKDAKSNLRLIYAAHKNYHMKYGIWISLDDPDEINQQLNLDIEENHWNYLTGIQPQWDGTGVAQAIGTIDGAIYKFKVHDDPNDPTGHEPGEPYCFSPDPCPY